MTLKALIAERKTHKNLIVDVTDERMNDVATYRVISPLTRDHNYAGMVFKDQWGGVWRVNEEPENISNAMEKWA